MPKVTFITSDDKSTTIEAKEGQNLLSIAEENDIPMRGACGGNGTCGTCMVEVEKNKENLSAMTEEEKQMMLPEDGSSRLGCKAEVEGDVTVRLLM